MPPGEEAAFLAPLPITRLWGVGQRTADSLASFGVRTIGDLAALPGDALERRFGKIGVALSERSVGIDPDVVDGGDPAKSVSHEHTFDVDTSVREVIERSLLGMADGVAGRLRGSGLKASTIALKLRDSNFRTITRQVTLAEPTDLTEPIYRAATQLLRKELKGQRIRLVGVAASNFREKEQLGAVHPDRRTSATPGRRGRRRDPQAVRRPCRHSCAARGRPSADPVRARPDDRRRAASRHRARPSGSRRGRRRGS